MNDNSEDAQIYRAILTRRRAALSKEMKEAEAEIVKQIGPEAYARVVMEGEMYFEWRKANPDARPSECSEAFFKIRSLVKAHLGIPE